jgi:oxygen-independent coproporphyrinogen-3 oxidase
MKKNPPLRLAPHPFDNALYLHLPFCKSKCAYCDFFSLAGRPRETMEKIIDAEIVGIDWFLESLGAETIDTAYVGGGTPSLLPPDLLRRLFARIAAAGRPREWTVEANPESLTGEFLDACAEAGVTRLSLGIQSFDDRLLGLLRRAGRAADNRRALDLVAARWSGDFSRDLSLDLITGIPTQSGRDALRDVDDALAARPAHLSLYELTLEEGTPLAEAVGSGECPSLPPARHAFWEEARARLTAAGYRHYEVSNFARPGKECLHNLRYWRLDPYIGVGPGAASTLAGAGGEVLRLETSRRFPEYCSADPGRYLSREVIPARSVLLEQLMMGLRLEEGIERSRILRRFGRPLEEILGGLWSDWLERGLVRPDAGAYACTDEGRLLLNTLLREAAAGTGNLHGLTVDWP